MNNNKDLSTVDSNVPEFTVKWEFTPVDYCGHCSYGKFVSSECYHVYPNGTRILVEVDPYDMCDVCGGIQSH